MNPFIVLCLASLGSGDTLFSLGRVDDVPGLLSVLFSLAEPITVTDRNEHYWPKSNKLSCSYTFTIQPKFSVLSYIVYIYTRS